MLPCWYRFRGGSSQCPRSLLQGQNILIMVFMVLNPSPKNVDKSFILLEHRMGFEPMNTGFADQRVSLFAIGASCRRAPRDLNARGGAMVCSLSTSAELRCEDTASPSCNRGRVWRLPRSTQLRR